MTRSFIVNSFQNNRKQVTRIFIPFLHNLLMDEILCSTFSMQTFSLFLGFLLKMKRMIRRTRTILSFGILPNLLSNEQQLSMETLMDSIFVIDSFTTRMHVVPYEFREFLGFFMIRKLQQFGMLTSPLLKGTKFGVKRDRRKLHIEPLHLPPEESRATSSATASFHAAEEKQKAATAAESSKISLKYETTSSSINSNQPESSIVVGKTPSESDQPQEEKPASSLASSLAAARAARAAAKASGDGSSNSIPKPVSISKSLNIPKDGIDF
jgi:hypothetical protein